jgi:hypothetical protein
LASAAAIRDGRFVAVGTNAEVMAYWGNNTQVAVLSADYFAIPEEEITRLESVLTTVGGHVVYATDAFARLAPFPLPFSPDRSPVKHYGVVLPICQAAGN